MIQLNLILGLGRAALCVMTAASTALAAPAFAQQTRTQSFTYNSRGEMITARVVNPAGADLSSSFGYDDVGNLTSTTAPGGLVMQADYDPARRVTEIRRDPNGATRSVSRFDYDVLGRLTRSRAGRVASPNPLTASHWADSSFTYSVDGLLTQATGPDGASIVYDYDPVGRLTRTQDPTGRISGYDYHADGRLKRLYEAVGTSGETAVIDLTYNGIGERERIRQARGIAGNPGVASESATYDTTYQYDAFNRLEQTVYPRPTSLSPHQTESFLYDANGNLEQHTTRRGDVISSSFDASNRLETRTTPEGVYRFEYYLTGEPKISRAPAGQDLEWRTVNNYDFAGRHTVEGQYLVQASGGGAYLIDRVVRYQYDANGNRTRIQWPDGFFVTYLYDAANRLTTICYNSSNCSTNLIARYEYDVQDRATRYTVYGAAGASVVQSDYDYSIDSDLTDLDVSFLRPGSNGQTVSFDYTYDAAGRLTGQDISNADWDWSPAQAGSPLSATYVANPLDQYESVDGQAFTYDLNGNLTAYRGQTLVYSSENRLETLSGAGVEADFSYDAEGRRKRMLVGNTSTEFVHAGTMEIAEYDGDTGALLRRYIPGPGVDQRVLMITCGSSADCAPNQSGADTYAYTADRLGHVIAVTHTRTGAIERYVYSPYGVELRGDESGNPFRYTGRRYDAETGLYYYRARYYDADLGRFLSTDPIGYADQWNLYAYVGNDPLNATDPTGMVADCEGMGTCPTSMYREGSAESSNCDAAGTCGSGQRSVSISEARADIMGGTAWVPVLDIPTEIANFVESPDLTGAAVLAVGLLPGPNPAKLVDEVVQLAGDGVAAASRNADLGTVFVDGAGNAYPTPPGGYLTGSPDGRFVQARDADGNMTGVRKDGPHGSNTHPDPRAQQPHGHQPGATNPDGTPWLPIRERE